MALVTGVFIVVQLFLAVKQSFSSEEQSAVVVEL